MRHLDVMSGRPGAHKPDKLGLSCKANKCSDVGTGIVSVLPTLETSPGECRHKCKSQHPLNNPSEWKKRKEFTKRINSCVQQQTNSMFDKLRGGNSVTNGWVIICGVMTVILYNRFRGQLIGLERLYRQWLFSKTRIGQNLWLKKSTMVMLVQNNGWLWHMPW